MKLVCASIPFVLLMALIACTELRDLAGPVDGFSIGVATWNCLPVAAGLAAMLVGLRLRGPLAAALITFSSVSALIVVLFHLAWVFDWGGTATSSSTSALAFLFVPLWAVAIAGVAAAAIWCIAYFAGRIAAAAPAQTPVNGSEAGKKARNDAADGDK